jgi:serine/threonine protein kinase
MDQNLANTSDLNEATLLETAPPLKNIIGKKFTEYTIQQLIGEGAFAEVYLARDKINRFVALKILKKQYSYDDNFVDMFRREATTAAQLNHEHIIVIYSQGAEEGLFYIAMEYAQEGTLEDYLERKENKPSRSEVRNFIQQIAEALDFAHANSVIHLDVKPSNILLSYNNRVKLADFGIARAQQPGTNRLSTVIQGTANYMAPEQATPNAKIDGRTDVYALAVVAYQMLTGSFPFNEPRTDDFVDQIQRKRANKPKPMENVPAYVQQVIFKSLHPAPELRHRSAKEFADDLIKSIDQWEASTAARKDRGDLLSVAVTAMEIEDWRLAKEYLERAQKIGSSKIVEDHLNEVVRRIKLQDEWTKVKESFDRADWESAIEALNRILQIEPNDSEALTKFAEAENQIELNRLYLEGERAFVEEDYPTAVERFEAIYRQTSDYRDVGERLQEFRRTQIKDEFNRLRVEALWALVENDLASARQYATQIDDLGLGHEHGASSFLKRFNLLVDKTANEFTENTQTLANLKDTLKVRDSRIEKQTTELAELKQHLANRQIDIEKLHKEINELQAEFTDRLYDYVSDLQNTLSYLEGNMIMKYSAKELIQTLRERIRTIALRGQQLESKTIY